METNKVQLVQHAENVQRLIEDEKLQGSPLSQRSTTEQDPHVLLSKLLQQLETLQGRGGGVSALETDSVAPDDEVDVVPDELVSSRTELNDAVADEIIKELKKVRRQNVVTHCLLSAILVLTLVGEISEIALISRVRRGLNNPFKALGGLLSGMIKRPENGQNIVEADVSSSLPEIKVEPPRVPIPEFSGGEGK